jgi:phage terminase small subunit|tara:strand:+ start:1904 stop:2518 length:615 start_codon:yes stop_codon:yes gene_type:complete
MAKTKTKTLTPRQEKFVSEYLINGNATQSAITAGYSQKTAKSMAQRLLTNVGIRQRLDKHIEKAAEKAIVTKAEVLKEWKKVAFTDMRDFVTYDGGGSVDLTPTSLLTDDQAAAIAEVKITANAQGQQTVNIRLLDKLKALHELGQHLGLLGDNSKNGNGNGGHVIQNFGPTLILAGPRDQYVDDGTERQADGSVLAPAGTPSD